MNDKLFFTWDSYRTAKLKECDVVYLVNLLENSNEKYDESLVSKIKNKLEDITDLLMESNKGYKNILFELADLKDELIAKHLDLIFELVKEDILYKEK